MAKTFVFVNQKGGVGKTTSAINIGAYIAITGKRVLLVDFDSQGNMSSGVGVSKDKPTIYELLSGESQPEETVKHTMIKNLDAENGVGIVNSRQTVKIPVTSDMIGKPASFEVYTFPKTDSEYLKMKITALSASGATITEKTFEEVPIAKNQVTTYSGNFFGSTPGTGDQDVNFTITVNTLWDDQIDTGF